GVGVSQYWLDIGTGPGGMGLYSQSAGTNLSASVSGLPTDGSTIYVRLWSLISGVWQFNDYTYNGGNTAKAVLNTPAPGSTLAGASATFGWNPGVGVSQYWLDIGGGAQGGIGIFSQSAGTNLSMNVSGLPTDGRTLYVRLWSQIAGAWQFN